MKELRTQRQNRALHLLFQIIADDLNEAGFDMKEVLKPTIDIVWTKEGVKEYLWKPVLKAMYQKKSTKEMTTKEIDKVFEVLNRHLGETTGHSWNFPSIDMVIDYEEIKEGKL